jgi:hypothetical protein
VARPEPINTGERLAEELTSWEERLSLLQATYEKYFCGIDRRAPDKERKAVSDAIRRLRTANVRNTSLRFRAQTLFAKLLTFERMWDRTLREMEEGTYRRDVFKARMRTKERAEISKPPPPPEDHDSPPQEAADSGPEIAPASMPPPPPRPSQPPPQAITDDHLKRLYATWLKAREQTGESTAGLSYESVASKIRAQIPGLLEKHNARAVDFKVVIKGGRAILKAVPKP